MIGNRRGWARTERGDVRELTKVLYSETHARVKPFESALHRPQTGYYDTIVHEAAALLESLVQNHPFIDGNKRVAFAVVNVFLRINGHALTTDSRPIYDSLLEFFNNGAFDMEHLVPWLEAIIVDLNEPSAPRHSP
jgi:death on curing protein